MMKKIPVFHTQRFFLGAFILLGLVFLIIGLKYQSGSNLIQTVAVTQLALGVFSWWQFSKKNYILYGDGLLRWKFANMDRERELNISEYKSIKEEWFGFELSTSDGKLEKISTDGMFKGDKKRFYKFLKAQL